MKKTYLDYSYDLNALWNIVKTDLWTSLLKIQAAYVPINIIALRMYN